MYKRMREIIKSYKGGESEKQIKEKFGEFGELVILKFKERLKEYHKNSNRVFVVELLDEKENLIHDESEIKIKKEYFSGVKKQAILTKYGDYGLYMIETFEENFKLPLYDSLGN